MRGHIRKRGEGCWEITVSLGFDPLTRKRIRRFRTVRGTKKEAERVLTEMLRQHDLGIDCDPGRMTLGEYLLKWLEGRRGQLAPSTFEGYAQIVRGHIVPALGHIPLAKLRPFHISEYYAQEKRSGKQRGRAGMTELSSTTLLYHHRVLHRALDDAVRLQMLPTNPADYVEAPKKAKREMKTLTPEEAAELLRVAEKEGEDWVYMPVLLALTTGMRLGEILGLKWEDVDFERGVIHVRRSLYHRRAEDWHFREPKTARGRRSIDCPPVLIKALRRHRAKQAEHRLSLGESYRDLGLVCPRPDGMPLHPSTVYHGFKKLADRLGLGINFHGLRHTHASLLLKQGVHPKIVSERLGHSQVSLTLDTYSHVVPGIQKEAAERIDALLSPGGGGKC